MSQLEHDLEAGLALIRKKYGNGYYFDGDYSDNDPRVCSIGAAVVVGTNLSINLCEMMYMSIPNWVDSLVMEHPRVIDIVWALANAVPPEFQKAALVNEDYEYVHEMVEDYNDSRGKRAAIKLWKDALERERKRMRNVECEVAKLKTLAAEVSSHAPAEAC
jgi:hypothetical protein